MKKSLRFTVSTPINNKYGSDKGKLLGYAQIEAIGYWNTEDKEWDADYATFDIEKVTIQVDGKEQDATMAYRISRKLSDTFADIIDGATISHCEYMFFGESVETDVDSSDVEQDMSAYTPLPTDAELRLARRNVESGKFSSGDLLGAISSICNDYNKTLRASL